jgi:membrane protein YdbS with pleckstrin-like domain
MLHRQLIDPIPVPAVFILIMVVLFVIFEVGYRVGRWWQIRTPEETQGPTDTFVGSILALLAFLLAITMGMASDRFDARRGLVLQETNAINTTYLRAGYLAAPYGDRSRALLREYVPLRINTDDRQRLAANLARSEEIQAELWAMVEEVARTESSDTFALYIESLNEVIDLHTTRTTSIIYGRVPETVVLLLILGSGVALGVVGYSAGLTRRRGLLSAVVLVVALAAVLTLVIDLDRPREGFLQVSQQPLIDLGTRLGPP